MTWQCDRVGFVILPGTLLVRARGGWQKSSVCPQVWAQVLFVNGVALRVLLHPPPLCRSLEADYSEG